MEWIPFWANKSDDWDERKICTTLLSIYLICVQQTLWLWIIETWDLKIETVGFFSFSLSLSEKVHWEDENELKCWNINKSSAYTMCGMLLSFASSHSSVHMIYIHIHTHTNIRTYMYIVHIHWKFMLMHSEYYIEFQSQWYTVCDVVVVRWGASVSASPGVRASSKVI